MMNLRKSEDIEVAIGISGIVYPRKLVLREKLPSIVTKYCCDLEPLTVTWGFVKSRETGKSSQYKQTMQTYKMCYYA